MSHKKKQDWKDNGELKSTQGKMKMKKENSFLVSVLDLSERRRRRRAAKSKQARKRRRRRVQDLFRTEWPSGPLATGAGCLAAEGAVAAAAAGMVVGMLSWTSGFSLVVILAVLPSLRAFLALYRITGCEREREREAKRRWVDLKRGLGEREPSVLHFDRWLIPLRQRLVL